MGTSAIVGTTIPLAAGYALGLRQKKSDSIVVSFFGDGAVDEGAFHETMNFAAVKKLPVLFICENNAYAIHSHHLSRHHSDNIWERARSYGMPAKRIEDGDIFKIYECTRRSVEQLRKGSGPLFLECVTCRWKEHVGPCDDFHMGYRNKEEVECWIVNDHVKMLRSLLDEGVVSAIEAEVEREIEEAFRFADESPFPAGDELYNDVFKE
jgi:TPP-dependent pyruvate/acetoin dehydrogenase alpha subunit